MDGGDLPSTVSAVLCGGPPWGFRIGHDTQQRPVIARTIPGGRADVAGMKEGDVIESVNSIPVSSSLDAQSIVQEMEGSGDLRIKINRLNNTPSDVVIASVLDSPAPVRKEFPPAFSSRSSTTSSGGSNYSPHLPRSLRFEGNPQQRTQDKRRFFESLGGSPRAMRDPLLARKIQMGLADAHAPPSENGTIVSGYDSVFGDICGAGSRISSEASVRSDIPSSVNSVNGDDDHCDLTLSLDPEDNTPRAPSHLANQFSPRQPHLPVSSPFSILFNPPPPPPFDPVPEAEPEPQYRPLSRAGPAPEPFPYYPTVPSEPTLQFRSFTPQPSPPTPVPAPKTSQIPVLTSRPGVLPTSPLPLSPSPSLQALHQALFSANPLPVEQPSFGQQNHQNSSMEPAGPSSAQWQMRTEMANVEPATCEIEVPGRRSVAALREQLAERLDVRGPGEKPQQQQQQRPKTPVKSWIKVHEPGGDNMGFGRVLDGPPPAASNFYQGVPPPSYNFVPHKKSPSQPPLPHDSSGSSTVSDESRSETRAPSLVAMLKPSPEIERAELHIQSNGFGNEIHSKPHEPQGTLMEARARSCTTPLPIRERPSIDRVSVERAVLQSADLESSELQRRNSASYSSLNSDHLGTIRRRPKAADGEMNHLPPDINGEHDSPSDSGYDASPESRKASMLTVRDSPPPFSGDSREAFTSLPPSALTKIEIELPKHEYAPPPPQPEPESVNTVDASCSPNYQRDDSDMGYWYRNMFKKLHKIENGQDASILKYRLNENRDHSRRQSSPSPPSVCTAIEVDTRRAKSVGRDPLPSTSSQSAPPPQHTYAQPQSGGPRGTTPVGRSSLTCNGHGPSSSSQKTVHFHLPSYRFVDEDARGIVTPTGRACLRCGLPRKHNDDALEKIYSNINHDYKTRQKRPGEDRTIAASRIADRLESTAAELEEFIASLDVTWTRRSKSNPSITPSTSKEQRQAKIAEGAVGRRAIEQRNIRIRRLDLAEEIETLKRITNDEMTTMRAEKLGEELDRERARRHGYQPNSVPSLAHNTDRFTGLLNAYGDDRGASPARSTNSSTGVRTAVVLHRFVPQTERELALNKGDIVRLRRDIDGNWMEGERNGRVGIFPASYVDIEECVDTIRQRLRAVYPFTSRNHNEMSLKMGDVVSFRRHIDENWTEGVNHIGEIGIFPTCYVRPIEEIHQDMPAVVPDRPKTPKIPGVSFVGGMSQSTRGDDGAFQAYDRPFDRMDRRSAEPQLQQNQPPVVQQQPQLQQRHSQPPAILMPALPPQMPLLQQPQYQQNGGCDAVPNVHEVEIRLPHPVPEASAHAEASRDQQARSRAMNPHHNLDDTLEDLLRTLPTSTSTPTLNTPQYPRQVEPEYRENPRYESNGYGETARPQPIVANGHGGRAEEQYGQQQPPRHNGYPESALTSPTAAQQPTAAPSSQNDKVAAWQQKHSSNGYTGTASIIPKGARTYRALYPYSPMNEDELELRVDDIIFVVEKCDDGWFIGTLLRTGQFGTFPGNFVEEH
ncbi:hypothetical protein PENTCL1PPCAC_16772 [Pristionchus entomophagus]|uniref:Uncharacterized protein n=1 Tax=Pristionchus entomophagus TaxID=358040 RepID=A0AAV5TK66_9BILA|nr:hypothetical protein PENTCL1PPCAC_16772 [Pristionchus entomophagus]